jgi:hypothetical protein
MRGTIALFNEAYLSSAFEAMRMNIAQEISREPKQQIINVNEAQYIEHVLSKARLLVPEVLEAEIQAESCEVEIPAEQHSASWSVTPGRSYLRQKITYEVPFTGIRICSDLLLRADHFRPVARGLNKTDFSSNLSFSIRRPSESKRSFAAV